MTRRPTCPGRLNATEPKVSQIERRNEGVDHANRIVICNPVIQAFRQQSRLPPISPLHEARHAQLRRLNAGIIAAQRFHTARVVTGFYCLFSLGPGFADHTASLQNSTTPPILIIVKITFADLTIIELGRITDGRFDWRQFQHSRFCFVHVL
ncbi:hypothetical protein [Bradyrhizobium genosp. P]|uniref:hypothetical protein n=1 Tax=Bradyrhizobium genosp. P TaxID=83641 RepID=UPI003CF19F1A